jgi:NAD(P)-binding Rossmann-like domain
MQRRKFIQITTAVTGLSFLQQACKKSHTITGKIVGASANIGHLLRDKKIVQPTKTIATKVLIIGGGVSGLSAARWLDMHNEKDFVLLDLEKNVGGNASSSSNQYSAFPWGAHYVPIPNNDLKEYLDFLQETNTITGFENNLPIYNEEHLCSDPQERLFINGYWQDGLVPNFGLTEDDKKQIASFLSKMNTYREAIGIDGREAFAIPVNNSSKDINYTNFDAITMQQWLTKNDYTSIYLHHYINYCTRDDFGTKYDEISAWIGIHYFAARKGKAANANHSDVLTWCEGNGFLVNHLKKNFSKNILTNHLATNIILQDNKVVVTVLNVLNNQCIQYIADECIVATPQFVNTRLMPFTNERNELINTHLQYAPWLVANLTVAHLQEKNGYPLSWDNVIHNSNSLGYVVATHQQVTQNKQINNLTYYLPLTQYPTKQARTNAYNKTYKEWQEIVLSDLETVHQNIRTATKHLDVMLWGHAMAKPLPLVITNNYRNILQQSIDNKIHFAHTDIAGISIFEEAFYQGIDAAKKILNKNA